MKERGTHDGKQLAGHLPAREDVVDDEGEPGPGSRRLGVVRALLDPAVGVLEDNVRRLGQGKVLARVRVHRRVVLDDLRELGARK